MNDNEDKKDDWQMIETSKSWMIMDSLYDACKIFKIVELMHEIELWGLKCP